MHRVREKEHRHVPCTEQTFFSFWNERTMKYSREKCRWHNEQSSRKGKRQKRVKTRMEEPENALSNSIREIQIEKRKWGEKDHGRF